IGVPNLPYADSALTREHRGSATGASSWNPSTRTAVASLLRRRLRMVRLGSRPHLAARCAVAALVFLSVPARAESGDLRILVASPGSPAGRAAAAMTGAGVVTTPRLFLAFDLASAHLVKCPTCTVTIDVASGVQVDKARAGQWTFPETDAPRATLRILGGYSDDFRTRKPFTRPTV